MKTKHTNRRKFLVQSSMASAAFIFPMHSFGDDLFSSPSNSNDLHVSIFSKHLQFLNYKDMSEAVAEMGFNGIDLTVRPKGHVLPDRVTEDLPLATDAMKSFGLEPMMFASNINDVNNPIQMQVLKTSSELGYKYYRPAWFKYPKDKPVMNIVEHAKKQLSELTAINKKLDLSASYHNHSGNYFGAPVWDLHQVISKLPTTEIGCQYDIMHGTVEGGKSWEVSLNLILPYINTLVVKDFIWGKKNGKWDKIYVPMGEGMVDFKKYFSILKKNKINVPVSLHVEHDLGGAEHGGKPSIETKEVMKTIQKDLEVLRKLWREAK